MKNINDYVVSIQENMEKKIEIIRGIEYHYELESLIKDLNGLPDTEKDIVLENLSDQVLWFECLEAKVDGSAMDTMLAEVLEPETVVEARILVLASRKISLSNVSGTITVYSPDNSYQENINFEIY